LPASNESLAEVNLLLNSIYFGTSLRQLLRQETVWYYLLPNHKITKTSSSCSNYKLCFFICQQSMVITAN